MIDIPDIIADLPLAADEHGSQGGYLALQDRPALTNYQEMCCGGKSARYEVAHSVLLRVEPRTSKSCCVLLMQEKMCF